MRKPIFGLALLEQGPKTWINDISASIWEKVINDHSNCRRMLGFGRVEHGFKVLSQPIPEIIPNLAILDVM